MGAILQDALWFASLGNCTDRGWTILDNTNLTFPADATFGLAVQKAAKTSAANYLERTFVATGADELTAATRFRTSSLRVACEFFVFYNSSTRRAGVRFTPAGTLQLLSSAGTVAATSAPGRVREGAWHRLILRVDDWGATANAAVILDGETVISTTINTGSAGSLPDRVRLQAPSDSAALTTDHVAFTGLQVRDDTGEFFMAADAPLDWRFEHLLPTGNVQEDWTRSTGSSSAALLDDAGQGDLNGNGDTDYVSHTVDGGSHRVMCSMADLAASAEEVHGVALIASVRQTSGSAEPFFFRCEHDGWSGGAVPADGRTVSTSYRSLDGIFNADPINEGDPWTPAGVNAADFGFREGSA